MLRRSEQFRHSEWASYRYRQAYRRSGDLYIGDPKPGVWQSGWHLVLAGGFVLLLGVLAWWLLLIGLWGLVGG